MSKLPLSQHTSAIPCEGGLSSEQIREHFREGSAALAEVLRDCAARKERAQHNTDGHKTEVLQASS